MRHVKEKPGVDGWGGGFAGGVGGGVGGGAQASDYCADGYFADTVEPDDMESMIRLMAQADLFEIEGLVATTGGAIPGEEWRI